MKRKYFYSTLSFFFLLTINSAIGEIIPTTESKFSAGDILDSSQHDSALIPTRPDSPLLNSIGEYEDAIEDIESSFGAYGAPLSQHLLGLGMVHQSKGHHKLAIEAFNRAIHISRINEGLYNLNQVPIVEELIESYIETSSWTEANEKHSYLYWLHQRNFGNSDPRLLPVIDKLSKWHLNSYSMDLGSTLFYHLINAHNLFSLSVDIIDANYGKNDLRLIEALRGLKASNYYLATYKPQNDTGININGSDAQSAEDRIRLSQYISNSFTSGKKAISRIVDIYENNPTAPLADQVRAKVELGDWYLLFNRWHSAQKVYTEAYNQLWQHEETKAEASKLFGRPTALPELPPVDRQVAKQRPKNSYVLVSFDVTPYGRARNIDILESQPMDRVSIRSRVRKALKVAKFRPRFEDGAPILTHNVTHRYMFADN